MSIPVSRRLDFTEIPVTDLSDLVAGKDDPISFGLQLTAPGRSCHPRRCSEPDGGRLRGSSTRPWPDAVTDVNVSEAIDIAESCVAGLSYAGRPLAAANASVLARLDDPVFVDNRLLRLWQLVTILREWRGDAHIGLLIAEPLDGCECTVVSEHLFHMPGVIRSTRAWSEDDWSKAVDRLRSRGWLDDDGVTEEGRAKRSLIERRTNEIDAAVWDGMTDAAVNRFGDLLEPAVKALTVGGYFAAVGRPPPGEGA